MRYSAEPDLESQNSRATGVRANVPYNPGTPAPLPNNPSYGRRVADDSNQTFPCESDTVLKSGFDIADKYQSCKSNKICTYLMPTILPILYIFIPITGPYLSI